MSQTSTGNMTIMAIEAAARQADDNKHGQEHKAFVLYGNGQITWQKGGDLLWERSEFIRHAAITDRHFCRLPRLTGPHESYALVTESDALRLRDMMKSVYGLGEAKQPTSAAVMLGDTIEEFNAPDYQAKCEQRLQALRELTSRKAPDVASSASYQTALQPQS